jgi:hypothetical protein
MNTLILCEGKNDAFVLSCIVNNICKYKTEHTKYKQIVLFTTENPLEYTTFCSKENDHVTIYAAGNSL